tara:strand:+ start:339 stop:659 length:321 start_codon:yes stop_codon:yes gene_type:complete
MYEVRDVKTKIKKVLDRHKDSQGNLASDSFRDMLAVEIECAFTKGNEAKENPLSIEMWKGYKDEEWHKEETEHGNRYTREKPNNQLELKLDVETKHFADDFHEGKI